MSELIRKIKNEKWDRKNIKTPEEKRRGYKIHKQETKKYHGIEYDLISLESYSGRKWVALESRFKFTKDLLYNLRKNFELSWDFLHYDSGGWNKETIEYQWEKMEEIAILQIDELYKLSEDIDKTLKDKINKLTEIATKFKAFIGRLGVE